MIKMAKWNNRADDTDLTPNSYTLCKSLLKDLLNIQHKIEMMGGFSNELTS